MVLTSYNYNLKIITASHLIKSINNQPEYGRTILYPDSPGSLSLLLKPCITGLIEQDRTLPMYSSPGRSQKSLTNQRPDLIWWNWWRHMDSNCGHMRVLARAAADCAPITSIKYIMEGLPGPSYPNMFEAFDISTNEYPQESVQDASQDTTKRSIIHNESLNLDVLPPYINYRLYKRRFWGILGLVSFSILCLRNHPYSCSGSDEHRVRDVMVLVWTNFQ
jgi:hypothetical protein